MYKRQGNPWPALFLVIQMAAHLMPISHIFYLRHLILTNLHALPASGMELTSLRRIRRGWNISLQNDTVSLQIRIWHRNSSCLLYTSTSFGALCTALSATIGTGNIVGVATAIAAGGPGALFWMIVAAFFGMATKYAEGLLAIKYRTIDKDCLLYTSRCV